MFDTMTITKILGAVCGSLLVFLFGAWAADALYSVGGSEHGHGEEHVQGYTIEVAAAEAPAEGAAVEDWAAVYAAADAAAGEKVFAKCKSCHKIDGGDATGPHLNGVVDRAKAAVPGFAYSDTLLAMVPATWTPENIENFIENPKAYAPGTKMSFAGLPKIEDRANVIAYLATLK